MQRHPTTAKPKYAAIAGASFAAMLASHAIAAPIVTVPSTTASAATGSLQVGIADPTSESLYGYSVEFEIVPESGATGSITFPQANSVSAAPGALLGSETPGYSLLSNTAVYASDFNFSGAQAAATGTPLLDLNYDVAPGSAGTFDIQILQDPASPYDAAIYDGDGNPIAGATFTGGSITIAAVPEPTAAALILAVSLLSRRRRAKDSCMNY